MLFTSLARSDLRGEDKGAGGRPHIQELIVEAVAQITSAVSGELLVNRLLKFLVDGAAQTKVQVAQLYLLYLEIKGTV